MEPAPFTNEIFRLLGLLAPPKVVAARRVAPLTPRVEEVKRPQKRRVIKKPGCVFQRSGKWTFRIAFMSKRMQKGGFPDEASCRADMARWLQAQIELHQGK